MRRLVPLSAALWLLACATTPPTPDSKEVDDFEVEGTKHLDEADLKEKLLTSESSWLPAWVPYFGHTGWYDPTSWQADLRRVQRFYEAHGYYQARVLEDVVTETRPQHVKLLVRLREGEAARVNTVDVTGLEALPPDVQREVVDELPLRTGDIFLEDAWARTKSLLGLRLREAGYAEAQVTGEALVDADALRVDLTLSVVPGLRYRFGKVFVATDSNAQVPPRLIADVASPDVAPGDLFSETALNQAQARVFQMGVFAAVKVNRGAPDRDRAIVPIVIDVREAPFRSMRFGVGLGGDLVRQEVRGTFEFTHRNLGLSRLFSKDARLDRLTFKAKLGLAFLPNIVDVIRQSPLAKWGPTWRFFVEYEVPRVFELRALSLQTSVGLVRALDNTYNYDGLEAKLGVLVRPRADLTIFPSLNVDGFLLYAPLALRDSAPSGAFGCPTFPNVCVVGYGDLTVEYDKRDNKLEAREGYYLGFSASAGAAQTDKVRGFVKVTPEARGYLSFGKHKRVTLAGRLKLGTLYAEDNLAPIVVRYFSGGTAMRGFAQRRLSPLLAIPTFDTARADPRCEGQEGCPLVQLPNYDRGQTLPVGGSGLFEAAFEARWQFADDWVLAVFNDWGLVGARPLFSGDDWGQVLYTAVGLGVRFRTMLGPIRLDLGVRLPFVGGPQSVALGEVKRFLSTPGCFGVGLAPEQAFSYGEGPVPYAGSPDGVCSVQLSIGEAF